MNAKKLLSLVFSAAFAVAALAGCGGSDFSREAARAANKAQDTVTFETDANLTKALQKALEDNAGDIRQAVADALGDELGSGDAVDLYTVSAEDAKTAAEAVAASIAKSVAGKQSKGAITMVKADDGAFYAITITTRTGSSGGSGSGSGSGNGSGSGSGTGDDTAETFTLEKIEITAQPTKTEYTVGESFDSTGMVVTATYKGSKGSSESKVVSGYTVDQNGAFTTNDISNSKKITIAYKENNVEVTAELTVKVTEKAIVFTPGNGILKVNRDDDGVLTKAEVEEVLKDSNANKNNVKQVEIAGSDVHTIGEGAFKEFDNLTNVILSESVKTIESRAFYGCNYLGSIGLSYVERIESSAFYECNALKEAKLDNATYIGDSAFSNCKFLNTLSLPKATHIGSLAFSECVLLYNVDLSSAQEIGDSAFYGCTQLTRVRLKDLTKIGSIVFLGNSVDKITIFYGEGREAAKTALKNKCSNIKTSGWEMTIGYSEENITFNKYDAYY